jgi:hypothetical protein
MYGYYCWFLCVISQQTQTLLLVEIDKWTVEVTETGTVLGPSLTVVNPKDV